MYQAIWALERILVLKILYCYTSIALSLLSTQIQKLPWEM